MISKQLRQYLFCLMGMTSLLVTLGLTTTADAVILAHDTFPTDGPLVGMVPSPGPGAAWAKHSGSDTARIINVTGGEAVLVQAGGSGEDDNTDFGAQGATATTYFGFDFSLPAADNVGIGGVDQNGLYFIHFRGDDNSTYRARTGVVAPSAGGDFGLAISADSSFLGPDGVTWAGDLNFDTTYRVVSSYDAATGASSLWLDPTDMSSTSITDAVGTSGTLVQSVALRQSSDYDGLQLVDNVVAATTFQEALTGVPEPTSMSLCGLALLGFLAFRRR